MKGFSEHSGRGRGGQGVRCVANLTGRAVGPRENMKRQRADKRAQQRENNELHHAAFGNPFESNEQTAAGIAPIKAARVVIMMGRNRSTLAS